MPRGADVEVEGQPYSMYCAKIRKSPQAWTAHPHCIHQQPSAAMFTAALLPYAKYVIFFTAGFLILPTGRDFVAPGKPIMPGDDKLLTAMNRDPIEKPCSAFMWRTFGLNFVFLSVIKYMVLFAGTMMSFYVLFAIYGTMAIGILGYYKPKFDAEGADIAPFLGLFTLETIAWYAIILS